MGSGEALLPCPPICTLSVTPADLCGKVFYNQCLAQALLINNPPFQIPIHVECLYSDRPLGICFRISAYLQFVTAKSCGLHSTPFWITNLMQMNIGASQNFSYNQQLFGTLLLLKLFGTLRGFAPPSQLLYGPYRLKNTFVSHHCAHGI